VLLLTRGGGSAEDLFCFNDVDLVKAVYDCTLPLVSAVGHEVDNSLSDWAADVRAATPSAGAELLSQDQRHRIQRLASYEKNLQWQVQSLLQRYRSRLASLQQACVSPQKIIQAQQVRCSNLDARIQKSMAYRIKHMQQSLESSALRLQALNPKAILERGYAMVSDASTQQILSNASGFQNNQSIHIQLADGQVDATVQAVHASTDNTG
jgi:exodeoxyribonuclease VII large subunit